MELSSTLTNKTDLSSVRLGMNRRNRSYPLASQELKKKRPHRTVTITGIKRYKYFLATVVLYSNKMYFVYKYKKIT
jgi:hypothetical protein